MPNPIPTPGQVFTGERVFTVEEVREFTRLSQDAGVHHVEPDAQGRLLVHGLLLATMPTRIGGMLDYLARTMNFEFLRPAFTGERIRCQVTATRVEPGEGRVQVAFEVSCTNEQGKEVMRATSTGIIRTPLP
jgi:acyl dehydratase